MNATACGPMVVFIDQSLDHLAKELIQQHLSAERWTGILVLQSRPRSHGVNARASGPLDESLDHLAKKSRAAFRTEGMSSPLVLQSRPKSQGVNAGACGPL